MTGTPMTMGRWQAGTGVMRSGFQNFWKDALIEQEQTSGLEERHKVLLLLCRECSLPS